MLWKLCRKSSLKELFRDLQLKRTREEEEEEGEALPCPCPRGVSLWLIIKPLRETWLSSERQSSIPWCHCDSRWKTNADNTSGKQLSQKQKQNTGQAIPQVYRMKSPKWWPGGSYDTKLHGRFSHRRWHNTLFDFQLLSGRILTLFHHQILIQEGVSSDDLNLFMAHLLGLTQQQWKHHTASHFINYTSLFLCQSVFTETLFMTASIPPLVSHDYMHLCSGTSLWRAAFC